MEKNGFRLIKNQIRRISYTELGLHYELHIQRLLKRYSFLLAHIGGRSDGGVDLRGTWNLHGKVHPALVQCKNISLKCPPTVVRELEGVASRLPNYIALLASTQPSSPQAKLRIQASPWPLLFLNITFAEDRMDEIVISEGLRRIMPGFGVTAAMQRDYSSGELKENLLFTLDNRPIWT